MGSAMAIGPATVCCKSARKRDPLSSPRAKLEASPGHPGTEARFTSPKPETAAVLVAEGIPEPIQN